MPTSGPLHCTVPTAYLGQVLIVRDALGRAVLVQRVNTSKLTVELSGIAPGAYSCEIGSSTARIAGRFVKE